MGVIALMGLIFFLAFSALILLTWSRKAPTTLSFLLLVASISLWAWTSGFPGHGRPRRGPSIAIELPGPVAMMYAGDNGVHFKCAWWNSRGRAVTIRFDRTAPGRYAFGLVANFLGFTIAALTHTYTESDMIVPPYVALVLPYWFLILLFGRAFLRISGISGLVSPYCRFSRYSYWPMAIVALTFAILNCIPSAWRPGAMIIADDLSGWARLIFNPASYPEICLHYGFPFICYRRGIIDGKTDHFFHGALLGWEQHRAMENLCIALAAVMIVGMTVEWIRKRGATRRCSVS
ncbi:MAG: hypothetical protein WKF75_08615 [Singulisphaera sp.]